VFKFTASSNPQVPAANYCIIAAFLTLSFADFHVILLCLYLLSQGKQIFSLLHNSFLAITLT